jgi:hypothetical protein
MKVHVHLGAHKTATTYLQRQLQRNITSLTAAGIFCPHQKTLQDAFGRYFNALVHLYPYAGLAIRPFLEGKIDALVGSAGAPSSAILSDENLAGMLAFNHKQGGLYRNVGRRTGLLASVLARHKPHFYFAIRSYKDFLPSAYLQLATNGREPEYQAYLDSFDLEKYGWTAAVRQIADTVGAENLTVWTYEKFARDNRSIFDLLVPGVELDIEADQSRRVVLPSMTMKGLRVMQAIEGKFSKPELARIAKVMRRFHFDEPNPRLGIEDPVLIARLNALYRADCAAIGEMGVAFHR